MYPVHFTPRLGINLIKFSAIVLSCAALLATAGYVGSARAADMQGSFGGSAHSASANAKAGPIAVTLDRAAFIACPCRGTRGAVRTNTVTDVSASALSRLVIDTDATHATALTNKSESTASVTNTASVYGLSILDGMITASQIEAVAIVEATPTSITVDASQSSWDNLVVNGTAIGDLESIPENTELSLPGIGKVILNKVVFGGGNRQKSLVVELLSVKVEQTNLFGLPVGSTMTIAQARAVFSREPADVVVSGSAYGTAANAQSGDAVQNRVGRAAAIHLGCRGSETERSRRASSVDLPGIFEAGTTHTTVIGGPTATGSSAQTSAEVDNVSLLGGLITASSIRAVAQDEMSDGSRTSSAQGSRITGLKIAGLPVPDMNQPNRQISLPLLGYVVLNEQIAPAGPSKPMAVNGLRVVITLPNVFDLAGGSEMVVAHATARAGR